MTTDYWECPKCLHKQVGTECRCRGPECPCSTLNALPAADRSDIIRAGAILLEDAFDHDLSDQVAEALYRRGIDTLEDEDAQDLLGSLQIEALDHFLADLGWTLAPRTEPTE